MTHCVASDSEVQWHRDQVCVHVYCRQLKEFVLQGVGIDCYSEPRISYGRVLSVRLYVCLSVCHTLALCQNDAS